MIPSVVAVPGSVTEIGPRKRSPPAVRPPGAAPAYQAVPTAGPGVLGQALFRLGFVPASESKPLTAEAASLQSSNAALSTEASAMESGIASLTSQVSTAESGISSLQSQIASLSSQLAGLESTLLGDQSTIASLRSQISALQSQVSALQSQIASDGSLISSLRSQLSGAASALNGLTAIAASPSRALQNNGLVSQDQAYDSSVNGYSGFVDPGVTGLAVAFAPGYSGLTSGTGTDARMQSSGPALGGRLASALGYVPVGQVTSAEAQVASLQSANASLKTRLSSDQSTLSSLQTRLSSDQSTLSGLRSQASSLQAQVSSAQAGVSTATSQIGSLRSQVGALQSRVAALTSQHQADLSTIATLRSQLSTTSGVLSLMRSSNLSPVSFSWSFGDGSSAGGPTPTHTYGDYGNYQPSVTITVAVPATPVTPARTVKRTFTLGRFVLGRWPTKLAGSGGGGTYGGTIVWTLTDTRGDPVSNCRIEQTVRDAAGVVTGVYDDATDAYGHVTYDYSGAGTVRARCLRNPTLTGQQGLAIY